MPKVGHVDECALPSSGWQAGALGVGGRGEQRSGSPKGRALPADSGTIPIRSTLFRAWFTAVSPFSSSGEHRYKSKLSQLGKILVKVSFLTSAFYSGHLKAPTGSSDWTFSLGPRFAPYFSGCVGLSLCLAQVKSRVSVSLWLAGGINFVLTFCPFHQFTPADQCKFSSSKDYKFCKTRSKGTDG